MTSKFFNRSMSSLFSRLIVAGAAVLLSCIVPSTRAETFSTAGGTLNWTNTTSWVEGTVPNAISATAIFNSPVANTTASLVGSTAGGGITVGSLTFNNTTATTIGIANGTAGGPLIFDNGGTGAIITTGGAGTGNNTISATSRFDDSVTATVNNTTATSSAGSLNMTGAISGSGGFTKAGDGTATFGTAAKTYTGATVLNGGRMRISALAAPTATSSFTINSGGQLDIITAAAGALSLGTGNLNLNGDGPTTGPTAAFKGAIRNDTSVVATINNATVLQSDTLLHVQGLSGSLTFTNTISGPGKLTLTAPGSDANQGQLVLNGLNTYAGGTLVSGGTLVVNGTSATLGTGNVTVDNTLSPLSIAKLTLASGVVNAIADTATLSLAGGGTAGVADQGFADLGAGINEIVGGLVLGGLDQVSGTYGSTTSTATFQNNEFFNGAGIITVVPVPEPSVFALTMVGGVIGLFVLRRKR
ncbi:MAG: autotransporter-associated beta strand repeat-containing protein [Verrucomicrobiota bacterium]